MRRIEIPGSLRCWTIRALPDSKSLLVAAGAKLSRYELTGNLLKVWDGDSLIEDFELSSKSDKVVVARASGDVEVIDLQSGNVTKRRRARMPEGTYAVSVAISNDGKIQRAAHSRSQRSKLRMLSETDSGTAYWSIDFPSTISDFDINRQATEIALVDGDSTVTCMQLEGMGNKRVGRRIRPPQAGRPRDIQYTGDGLWLVVPLERASHGGGAVSIFDVTSYKFGKELGRFEKYAAFAAASPSRNFVAAAAFDQKLRIWKPSSNPTVVALKNQPKVPPEDDGPKKNEPQKTEPKKAEPKDDDKKSINPIPKKEDPPLVVGKPGTTHPIKSHACGREVPTAIDFSADSRFIAANIGNSLFIWDARTLELKGTFSETLNYSQAKTIEFAGGNKFVLAGAYRDAYLYSVQTGKRLKYRVRGNMRSISFQHKGYIQDSVISPDGSMILTASGGGSSEVDNRVRLWSPKTVTVLRIFEGATQPILRTRFGPKGTVVGVSQAGVIFRWDMRKQKTLSTVTTEANPERAAALSPDGRFLFAPLKKKYNEFGMFDCVTGKLIRIFSGHNGYISALAVSADGKRVVSGNYGRRGLEHNVYKLWDTQTGNELWRFDGAEEGARTVAISPNQKYIAASSSDGGFRLWRVPDHLVPKASKKK